MEIKMNQPNQKYETRLVIYKRGALIYAILSLAVTAAAFIIGAEAESRYLADNFFTYLFYAFVILTVAFAASALFSFKGHGIVRREKSKTSLLSALTCAGAICVDFTLLPAVVSGENKLIAILILICSLFAIIFSLSDIFPFGKGLILASGYLQIFFCLLLIALLYLDHSIEMNAPVKLLAQFSLAAVALGTLSELRIHADRSIAGMYVFSAIFSVTLPSAAAVASLTEALTDPVKYTSIYLAAPLFALSFAIPSFIKLMRAGLVKAENNEPELESNRLSVEEIIKETCDSSTEEDGN